MLSYRSLVTVGVSLILATSVFANDENNNTQRPVNQNGQPLMQIADGNMNNEAASKVDLNKASAKELMKVTGITSGKAKSIVAYRHKHGDFKSVDDLKNVKGFRKMSEQALQKIQEQVTIN